MPEYSDMHKRRKPERRWNATLNTARFDISSKQEMMSAIADQKWLEKQPDLNSCDCCAAPLFISQTIFEAGKRAWSFYQSVCQTQLKHLQSDFFNRPSALRCAKYDAILCHIFACGVHSIGLRYGMNGPSTHIAPNES
jgi:peptide methionine sulfoxide reductase MsrB